MQNDLIQKQTLKTIYISRHKNPLYRNLKNKNLEVEEKAIALSSFITKILITCSKINNVDTRKEFVEKMNLIKMNQAINDYAIFNKTNKLEKCLQNIRNSIQIFEKKCKKSEV